MASGVQAAYFTVLNSTLYSYNYAFTLYFSSQVLERSMGLHICAANFVKEHFMLCKNEVKMKDILVGSTIKYWMMITYVYFGSFWVLESNGIQPKLFIIKILCSIEILTVGYVEMSANTKRTMVLLNLIKDYRELALTAPDCGDFFGNMMGIYWGLSDGDRSEWD